jgi:hypothetical protein
MQEIFQLNNLIQVLIAHACKTKKKEWDYLLNLEPHGFMLFRLSLEKRKRKNGLY